MLGSKENWLVGWHCKYVGGLGSMGQTSLDVVVVLDSSVKGEHSGQDASY